MATPPKKPRAGKGAPPAPGETPGALGSITEKAESGALVNMNLKVSPEFHKRVKLQPYCMTAT